MSDDFSRLRATSLFRDATFEVWLAVQIALIGCGTIGARLAIEIVRSGARLWVCDPDVVQPHDRVLLNAPPGTPKVTAVIAECDRIRRGAATGCIDDVRHVGIGAFTRFDLVIDTSDDQQLGPYLTEVTNGVDRPLMRIAVDGSGETEFGRVLFSDHRNGGACQMCSLSLDDLYNLGGRTPCPGAPAADRPPTLAAGPTASMMASLGLIQAIRWATGNDRHLVQNREVFLDLTNMQLLSMQLPRSEDCLSGHESWDLTELPSARVRTLAELFTEAERRLGTDDVRIAPYGHPLCVEAGCECGAVALALGTSYADPPLCDHCETPMTWRLETQRTAITRAIADQFQALDRPLAALGFPIEGPMFTAYADGRPPLRLLLTEES